MALTKSFGFLASTSFYLKRSRQAGVSIPLLQKAWARETLTRFNVSLDVSGTVSESRPLILVGNHISYMDIPLLMSAADGISFVAKNELSKWPIIGQAAMAMNTIFVKRGCKTSRSLARQSIAEGIANNKRVVVFPSGTTTLQETVPWRLGIFEIAKDLGVEVQPFRLTYSPLRSTAFIDEDIFPIHLYRLFNLPKIQARLEFGEPFKVLDPTAESQKWKAWTQDWAH